MPWLNGAGWYLAYLNGVPGGLWHHTRCTAPFFHCHRVFFLHQQLLLRGLRQGFFSQGFCCCRGLSGQDWHPCEGWLLCLLWTLLWQLHRLLALLLLLQCLLWGCLLLGGYWWCGLYGGSGTGLWVWSWLRLPAGGWGPGGRRTGCAGDFPGAGQPFQHLDLTHNGS